MLQKRLYYFPKAEIRIHNLDGMDFECKSHEPISIATRSRTYLKFVIGAVVQTFVCSFET